MHNPARRLRPLVVLWVVWTVAFGVPSQAAADFSRCLAGIKTAAQKAGVSRSVTDRALGGVTLDEKVLRFSRAQPEFKTPIWDYFAVLVDDERVRDGKAKLAEEADVLAAAERRFGVDRHVIAAVWGVETDYGRITGTHFLPQALATLTCASGRRQSFWRGELIAALQLVERGDLDLNQLHGSWAGAFGQTQFIPSTYRRLAVDFDGDGRRDLVGSTADALGSTANYLKRAGWRTGQPWMIEVKAPPGYRGPKGRKAKAALSTWNQRGLVRGDGARLSGGGSAGLLLPAGSRGPGFLTFRNFDAIYAYNQAESYALAISHLADRLAGLPALRTPWPVTDPGLSRAERLRLQERLLARGYDVGEVDGKVGRQTRAAIEAAERDLGLPATGRPGQRILRALSDS